MGSIVKPNTFTASTTIVASEFNDNFDTIYDEFNGNIGAANLATSAVATAKIADDAVTNAKLADDAVATANIINNAVTSAKLKAAQSDSTPGSLADIGTGYSTGATLSVTAGTYLLIARATCTTSVAQPTAHVCEIYNSTDAAILDTITIKSEYVSGTQSAYLAATNMVITTLAATKTIIARYKVDDSGGTSSVNSIKLIAIPVGV